jgi:hypothetical protein
MKGRQWIDQAHEYKEDVYNPVTQWRMAMVQWIGPELPAKMREGFLPGSSLPECQFTMAWSCCQHIQDCCTRQQPCWERSRMVRPCQQSCCRRYSNSYLLSLDHDPVLIAHGHQVGIIGCEEVIAEGAVKDYILSCCPIPPEKVY